MKKLILIPILTSVLLSSCYKEELKSLKSNDLIISEISQSKVKQTSQGITLVTTFDETNGEVSIIQQNGPQNRIFLTYRAYRENNGVYQMVSNYNNARYLNKFVILAYSTIPIGSKYKIELDIRLTNGGLYNVRFDGKRR